MTKTYKSGKHAAAAYVRAGKAAGTITSLGGGWFRADALRQRQGSSKVLVQGLWSVAARLKQMGLLTPLQDGGVKLEWPVVDAGILAANRAFARSARVED